LGIPEISIYKTFIPANPFSPVQIAAMPEGVLAFLQYDFYNGMLATLIWTTVRHYQLQVLKASVGLEGQKWWTVVFILFVNVLFVGPGAAVVGFASLREAELELTVMDFEKAERDKIDDEHDAEIEGAAKGSDRESCSE
jgi:hypothetical protein